MTKFIIILLSAVFINNYVLSRFLGICPFLGVSKKLDSATGMSLAVIFVMLMATAVTFPIQKYLLEPNNLVYLQTIVFILVIAALVQLVEIVLKKYIPSLHKSLGVYLPLITTNCAVLGRSYGQCSRQRSGIFSRYGHVLRCTLYNRRQRYSRKLQRLAYHSHCCRYHFPFLYGFWRSD